MKPEDEDRIKESLSPKEQQVYELRKEGYTIKEIAKIMGVSQAQVYNKYNQPLLKAFGIKNWGELEGISTKTGMPMVSTEPSSVIQTTKKKGVKIPRALISVLIFFSIFFFCNICAPSFVAPIWSLVVGDPSRYTKDQLHQFLNLGIGLVIFQEIIIVLFAIFVIRATTKKLSL